MDIENTLVYDNPEIEREGTLSEGERQLSAQIQQLIKNNKFTISSLLILMPSITISAYHDWRHPLVGMSLGVLAQLSIIMVSMEQIGKHEPKE